MPPSFLTVFLILPLIYYIIESIKKGSNPMSDIRDAFFKAQKKNPNSTIVQEAVQFHKEKVKQEKWDRLERLMIQKEQEEKERKLEEALKEATRRSKELEVVTNLLPFRFHYHHFGDYSMTFGIVFARDLEDAKEKVLKHCEEVISYYKIDGDEFYQTMDSYKPFVEPVDLSNGLTIIGSYME